MESILSLPFIYFIILFYLVQGGDGLFNEILNGLLSSRFKTEFPPVPPEFMASPGEDPSTSVPIPNEINAGTFNPNEDQFPLLSTSRHYESRFPSSSMYQNCYIIVMMYPDFGFDQLI